MITVSVEFLYHFRCHTCDRWWSIGDYQWVDRALILCPHCGKTHRLPDNPLLAEDFKPQTSGDIDEH